MADLINLYRHGQSMWLDDIHRGLVSDGGLERLISEGLRGVTSNPAIFHQAVSQSDQYDDAIRDLLQADHQMSGEALYHWLAVQDAQWAADDLLPVYDSSEGRDGFISVEISPHTADDAQAIVDAARHLWRSLHRPNGMIQIPGTQAGVTALEALVAEGINVDLTSVFSMVRYQEALTAYCRALGQIEQPARVASVVSFPIARLDARVDEELDAVDRPEAQELKGHIAVAHAKLVYQAYQRFLASEAFKIQQGRGARGQRPLWTSMRPENPNYRDVGYIERLIGRDTVVSVPPHTLDQFLDHGEIYDSLTSHLEESERQLTMTAEFGVKLEEVANELTAERVSEGQTAYDQVVATLAAKRVEVAGDYAG